MDAAQIRSATLQAQSALEKMFPATIKYEGQEYPAACRGLTQANTLTEKGFTYQFDIVFRVRKTLMESAPEEGKRLEWEGQSFRVEKVPNRPQDGAWYMGCMSTEK